MDTAKYRLWFVCALVTAISGIRAAPLPDSAPLNPMIAGGEALAQQRFDDALAFFRFAAKRDPANPEPLFFEAVTLNRLGRAAEALERLDVALAAGSHEPELFFEKGWSLLMLERWREAAEQLEAYEKDHPGRGQTSEFLGAAYLALRKDGQAEKQFLEAIRRDPELGPAVDGYLKILASRHNESARQAGVTPPDSGVPLKGRPLSLSLSEGFGYNSDVRGRQDVLINDINLGPTYPQQVTQPKRSSTFEESAINVGITLLGSPMTDHLTAEYSFLADDYNRTEAKGDLIDQRIAFDFTHYFAPSFSVSMQIFDDNILLDGDYFRNLVEGRCAATWHITASLAAQASIAYGYDRYLRTPGSYSPEGRVQTLAAIASWTSPISNFRLEAGFFNTRDFTLRDFNTIGLFTFDDNINGFSASAVLPLPGALTARLEFTHEFDRYLTPEFLNSHNSTPLISRRDYINDFSVRITKAFTSHFSVYATYTYVDDGSNIAFYKFDQHVVSSGVAWNF